MLSKNQNAITFLVFSVQIVCITVQIAPQFLVTAITILIMYSTLQPYRPCSLEMPQETSRRLESAPLILLQDGLGLLMCKILL